MRLKNLFESTNIAEDHGRLFSPNIPKNEPTKIGVMDGIEIYGSKEFKGLDTISIRDESGILSYCHISDSLTDRAFILKELWTRADQRGKGLATKILVFLLRKLNIKLLIAKDEILSDDSRKMILKSLQANQFKAYSKDDVILSIDEVEKMFSKFGSTEDELILSERSLNIELMSDKNKDTGSSYLVVAEGLD